MDAIKVTNFRKILVKKPFFELTPKGYMTHDGYCRNEVSDNEDPQMPQDTLYRVIKTQKDFLREFYPTSHKIFDKNLYPDIWRKNPEDGKWYVQEIQRTAFAFQQVIHTKHVLHMTGNDIQFELAGDPEMKKQEEYINLLAKFKKGWYMHDMEIRHYEAVCSYMKVAEAAVVGFFDKNKKFGTRTLAFDRGDTLYPQFDPLTGELVVFARKYYDFDEEGNEKIEWVEVWDDKTFYRFKKQVNEGKVKETIKRIAKIFGIDDYTCVEEKAHGFPFIPVAYVRNDDGPCWSAVQKNIEDYEEAFSYLCENNKAYLRAMGVKDYIEKNIPALQKMKTSYDTYIEVSENKGGEYHIYRTTVSHKWHILQTNYLRHNTLITMTTGKFITNLDLTLLSNIYLSHLKNT